MRDRVTITGLHNIAWFMYLLGSRAGLALRHPPGIWRSYHRRCHRSRGEIWALGPGMARQVLTKVRKIEGRSGRIGVGIGVGPATGLGR
jgi:hypothetical protein